MHAASSGPVLRIEGLTVRLPPRADRANAIEEIDLTVDRGEIVCIVGESGSGKSVTAFAVMGLLPPGQLVPTAGKVELLGEDLLKADAKRLHELRGVRMSMIFQEPMTALNPVMTCGRQIEEVLVTHTRLGPEERQQRIRRIVEQVQLPDPERMIRAYPHQLSGGQRQRIMIAMALVLEPALLIADEPTTALDVTTQSQILKLVRDIQATHDMGVLFITHDFGVVADIADRVAVMQHGRIVEVGRTAEILGRPAHAYTRMLIGAVPSLTPRPTQRDPSAPVVLQTERLAKIYELGGLFVRGRSVRAAEDVTVEIRRGETLGIVGESGSGKSTVARCIARLIEPTAGAIRLGDVDIAKLPAGKLHDHRRRVQIVFQDPYRSLNPRRTVGASVIEGPMNYGLPAAEAWARARRLMETVRLDPESLDRYPHQFSGGQRQRICIARALAMEPAILIADEAVSALDVSVQAQVLKLLADIRRRFDLAMLFITHDLRVAAQVCDTVAVMQNGRVVEYGEAERIFTAPQHEYTRALFEAAPGRGWTFGEAAA